MVPVVSPCEFKPWPKTPRLYRKITITEKIDGTNGAVIVAEDGSVAAQSRKRIITPDEDHHGFAAWVYDNAGGLADALGPGHHYGEWWGSGINRGYKWANGEKFFSLFNTRRWRPQMDKLSQVDALDIVPILYEGPYTDWAIPATLERLRHDGSRIDYLDWDSDFEEKYPAEGICIFFDNANQVFKVTLENDDAKCDEKQMESVA